MKYCPECGNPHECAAEVVIDAEAEETKRVRIQADRDIEIARLQAGAAKAIAATEAESEAAHLEGVIEGVELATDPGEPDPAEGGDPIVVQVDAGDQDTDEVDVEEPPEVEPIPEPAGKPKGWWDNYR